MVVWLVWSCHTLCHTSVTYHAVCVNATLLALLISSPNNWAESEKSASSDMSRFTKMLVSMDAHMTMEALICNVSLLTLFVWLDHQRHVLSCTLRVRLLGRPAVACPQSLQIPACPSHSFLPTFFPPTSTFTYCCASLHCQEAESKGEKGDAGDEVLDLVSVFPAYCAVRPVLLRFIGQALKFSVEFAISVLVALWCLAVFSGQNTGQNERMSLKSWSDRLRANSVWCQTKMVSEALHKTMWMTQTQSPDITFTLVYCWAPKVHLSGIPWYQGSCFEHVKEAEITQFAKALCLLFWRLALAFCHFVQSISLQTSV